MIYLAKYGVQTVISFPMIKRGVVDFAATADWTPATGDTKLSKDQGSAANSTNNPVAVAGTGSVGWDITLTATELQCAELAIQIVDSATKAVEDQYLIVYTYGNASAKIQADLSDAVRLGLTSLPAQPAESAGGLFTRGSGAGQINQDANGRIDVNLKAILGTLLTETAGQIAGGFKKLFDVTTPVFTLLSVNQTGDNYARLGAPAGASIAADVAAVKTDVDAIPTTKTGYALTSAYDPAKTAAQAGDAMALTSGERTTLAGVVWDRLTSAITTTGSIGKLIKDNLDAAISSRLASGSYTAPDNADIVSIKAKTDNLPSSPAATGDAMTLTSGERTTLAGVIWDRLTSAITTVGSIGKLIKDNLDAAVSSRMATFVYTAPLDAAGVRAAVGLATANLDTQLDVPVSTRLAAVDYTAPDNADIAAIKLKTDHLPDSDIVNTAGKIWALDSDGNSLTSGGGGSLTEADIRDALGMASADLDTQLDTIKSSADAASRPGDAMALTSGERTTLVAAVWDALTSGMITVGSIGKLVKDYLDAPVSSKLSADDYTTPDNTSITAIKERTDNLPDAPAATGDAMALTTGERTSIVSALLATAYEGSESLRTYFRLSRAILIGVVTGQPGSPIFKSLDGTKDRVIATVDEDGNRTAVTVDGS